MQGTDLCLELTNCLMKVSLCAHLLLATSLITHGPESCFLLCLRPNSRVGLLLPERACIATGRVILRPLLAGAAQTCWLRNIMAIAVEMKQGECL